MAIKLAIDGPMDHLQHDRPMQFILMSIGINNRGVPIYRIGNILAADMAKFSISGIGISFLKLYRYFY